MVLENSTQVLDPKASAEDPKASDESKETPQISDQSSEETQPIIEALQKQVSDYKARQSGADKRTATLEQELKATKEQLAKVEQQKLEDELAVLTEAGEDKAAKVLKNVVDRAKSALERERALDERERGLKERETKVSQTEQENAIVSIASEYKVDQKKLEAAATKLKITDREGLKMVAVDLLGGVVPATTPEQKPSSKTPPVHTGLKGLISSQKPDESKLSPRELIQSGLEEERKKKKK
jgi:uncharacterized protein involved in exopolysaccharide biosynthesis